jgi:NodT family efflux transporter outer membrane factor (OMF) lipoprotein
VPRLGSTYVELRQETPERLRAVAGRAALAAAVLLTIAGCAIVPQESPSALPFAVPPAWSGEMSVAAPGDTRSLAQWWQRFDDPLLARLVEDALRANTDVASAEAAVRQARAARDVAAAALLPFVSGSASAARSSAGGRSLGNSFRAGLDASWELDIFGENRAGLNASEAALGASAATLGNVQVSIAAEVALDYITLRGTQARYAIAQSNLETQVETLQITEWRVQAGLATSLDEEQLRSGVEQTRALLPALNTAIEQTRHALAVLTGKPPAALTAELAATGPIPKAPDTLAVSFPAETLRQRPDVRAAEYQVSAAMARVTQADAARYPNFKIGGTLGLASVTLGALTSGSSVLTSLLANMSVPIFEGGALLAQVRGQQAALDQAHSAYEAAVLQALRDVEDALVALRGDRDRLAHLQIAAESAANASLLARDRYSTGLVDFQTVLDTLRNQLTTQESVANAMTDLGNDYVRLYKALGGGWTPGGAEAVAAVSSNNASPSSAAGKT